MSECSSCGAVHSDLVDSLKDLSKPRHCGKGEVLFEQGQPPTSLFWIRSGAVKVTRSSGMGRDVITEILFPGDLCGVLCSLDSRPYPVQGTCLIDSEVWAIPREAFARLAQEKPQLMAAATGICRGKMRQQREMLVGMAADRAEPRAARALLMLGERMGRDTPEGLAMPALLDRQEFSELIGTTVETAIRVLSRFRKSGWIQEREGVVWLRDLAALKTVAGQ